MSTRLRTGLVLATTTLGLLAAIPAYAGSAAPGQPATSSGTSAASVRPAALPAVSTAVPRAGQCYLYSYKQGMAASSPTPPVSCATRHTAWTYYVGTFTGAAAKATSIMSPALMRPALAACYARRVATFGTRVHLTRVRFAWFSPSAAQWARGARFFRCDAVIEAGLSAYESMPPRLPSVLATAAGLERFRACERTGAGRVPCSRPHDARAVTWVTLGSPTMKYPGDAKVAGLAVARCTASLAALPGAPALAYETWPLAAAWAAGHHVSTCYVAD